VRLTDWERPVTSKAFRPRLSRVVALAAISVGLAAVFGLDRATGNLPFQHLYYLPIVLAAMQFGQRGAAATSISAVVLYHLANPVLLRIHHEAADVVQIVLFVAIGSLTAALREDADRLEILAGTDDLTGLYNLRAFEQRLREVIRTCRAAGSALTLLVLDLDGLKALNDVHGHLTGAEAVRTVGRIAAAHLPDGAFACRYGGDEFVVAFPGLAAPAAHERAAAILGSVRSAAPALAGHPFPAGTLSVSIGLACIQPAAWSAVTDVEPDALGEAVFHAADAALYEAKRAGKGRISVAPTHAGSENWGVSARAHGNPSPRS
jgi:diguanylate cyclase (GGDEF)-like protein